MRNSGFSHDPIGWLALDRYITIHEESLRRLESYAILDSGLTTTFTNDRVRIIGFLLCDGGVGLYVKIVLELNRYNQVRGLQFTYQAQMPGLLVRPIFRYDNAHQYTLEGHPDAFHKHVWNYQTWEEIEPPAWIGRYHWPTLAQVVEEVWDWWQVIGQHLGD